MMTPHSSQTPKYGQGTPSQQAHGQFLRPGQPISTSRGPPSYRASPYSVTASPRNSSHHRKQQSAEEDDWERADMAWGKKDSSKSSSKG